MSTPQHDSTPLALPVGPALLGLLALAGSPAARLQLRPQEGVLDGRITPVVRVVENARPAVVSILSEGPRRQVKDFWGRLLAMQPNQTFGSGVVLFDDGYVMTNFHVVQGAQRIVVRFDAADDPTEYTAHVVSTVPNEDMALIKLDSDGPFPTIPMCSTDPILGETVVAIGNPYGQTHTVSTGIVSGLHRNISVSTGQEFRGLLQTDASINPGNSGGPLLNINGELIAINSAMNTMAENIGFAIPVSRVRSVLNDQLLSTTNQRSYLGFELDEDALTVSRVDRGGPADAAGLRVDDRLLEMNGRPIEDRESYRLASIQILPGEHVALRAQRGGATVDVEIDAWTAANGHLLRRLGVTADSFSIGQWNATQVVQVAYVEPDGPGAHLGLAPGDLIEYAQISGRRSRRVGSPEELAVLVKRLEPGEAIEIELWRDDNGNGVLERFPNGYSELYRGEIEVR